MKLYNSSEIDVSKILEFLDSPKLDNNIIALLQLYAKSSRKNFQYLVQNLVNITSVGFEELNRQHTNSMVAIEHVLCLFSQNKISDDMYFSSTWNAFSILIPSFDIFYRHSSAIQDAYLKFEKIFAQKREKFLAKDYWFTEITNYNWWLKVDEFFINRNKI